MSKRARILLIIGIVIAVLVMSSSLISQLLVRLWWFQETGYTQVFWTSWRTRALLFAIFGVAAAVVIALNAYLAYRLRPAFRPLTAEQQNLEQYRRAIEPRGKLMLIGLALAAFLFAGYGAQSQWQSYLLWSNSTPFGTADPQFGIDVSFYTFELPFLRFVLTFVMTIVILGLIAAATIHYLYGGIRVNTPGDRFSTGALAHISVLLGIFVLLKAFGYWLDRYDLLFSTRGKNFYGAAAADINAMLPAKTILSIVAIICALAFFATLFMKNFAVPAMALALMVVASIAIGAAYPAIYNRAVVTPNADVKEAPYIERAMEATLAAYGLQDVEYQPYNVETTADANVIKADTGTIPNLRLLDPNVISEVVQQNEQVVRVYSFANKLDIDRYTINGESKEYVVAVRELDPSKFSETQQNWINLHTYYTHGYGFIAAPANEVDDKGMPEFVNSGFGEGEIPVTQPRIYYGELNPEYSIVGSEDGADREYDRPASESGDGGDQKTTYDGEGGVPVNNFFRKSVFAINYAETNFLLNSSIGENSKIIYDRTPRERVEQVAPFLTVDGDPYPAVIDGRIVWILDGYTTSDGYPYAAQMSLRDTTADAQTGTGTAALPDEMVNYVRNSVKATVDAYDGTVTLYEWDEKDPVLKTWEKAYPGLVKAKSEIPTELSEHFRYPEDLFKIQRELLTQYHVTDPSKFYSQDGFWKVVADPTGGTGDQPAYYVRSQLPGEDVASFKITSPLTAQNKDNITAYVSAESDPENYGKITVLTMPAAENTFGPKQVQNQFTNDEEIKTKLNLLRQGNSTAVEFGNLLTVPIAGGLLYVEPVYVRSSYPTLQFVLLQFGGRIAWAPTIKEGLETLFGPGAGDNAQATANVDAAPDAGGSGGSTETNSGSADPGGSSASAQQAVNQANADLQAAITAYETAAQAGDYAAMGQAQQDIIDAAAALDAALAQQNAAGTTEAAPSSDSAAPSSPGG